MTPTTLLLALAALQAPQISDSAIRGILQSRLEKEGATAIVAGLIAPDGSRRVVAAGPADGNTVFEIGSVTKVFTGLLLSQMVSRGEARFDQPVGELLPDSVTVPSRNGRQITLLDLATQSSGLPRMPTNFAPADMANPYADYDARRLYQFLSGHTLPRDVGQSYEYSNLGVGLLGLALSRRAGQSYEQALTSRVLEPLGLRDTRITLSPDLTRRLTPGHSAAGEVVPNWTLDALAGAGALRSTVNDMLAFLAGNLDTTRSPLARILADAQRARYAASPGLKLALAWHVVAPRGDTLVWHNGGTAGYHSFIGFMPGRKTAVVVLSNSAADVDDIALHLLDDRAPLRTPRVLPVVTLGEDVLERYVGVYSLAPTFELAVTREGAQLYLQATGQPKIRLHPSAVDEFFIREVEASVSFVSQGGQVTAVILHQGGRDIRGEKKRE
jgi:CubicO group peptidase (beta-lactamase class C family)